MPSSSGCKEPKMHVPLRGAAIRMWRYQSSWGRYIYTAEGLGSDSASRPWSPATASAPRASSVLHVLLASPQHPCLLRFPGSVMAPKMLMRPARLAMAVPPASGSRPSAARPVRDAAPFSRLDGSALVGGVASPSSLVSLCPFWVFTFVS